MATKNRPTPHEKKLANKFQESKLTGDPYNEILMQWSKEIRGSTPKSFHEENKITAVLDFKKAYELQPDFLTARINAAQTYKELGFSNLAIQEIDKALGFDDENTGLYLLRGSINGEIASRKTSDKYGDKYYLQEIYGDKRIVQEIGDFKKSVFKDSCNDFKDAAERVSLIAGLYMISSEPCARLEYEVDEKLFSDTLKNLDSIIAFHRKAFTPYFDSTTGYMQKEAARKGAGSDKNAKERRAYESFERYIQATFAKGMLRLIAGEKKEACDLLGYTYGVHTKLSIIMSFELDSNLDNKSKNYRRFDPWNFDNVCDFDFSGDR